MSKSKNPVTIDTSNQGEELGAPLAPKSGDAKHTVANLDALVSKTSDQANHFDGGHQPGVGGIHSAETLSQYLKTRSHKPTFGDNQK